MWPFSGDSAVQLDRCQTACDDGSMIPEREDDNERREEEPYASTTGEDAGEGVSEAREGSITIEQYEGANTWRDLKDISLRKLAEGLVRIEKRVVAIEARMATREDLELMATKQDLAGMATKEDLNRMASKEDLARAKQSIIKWSSGVVMAGVLTGVGLMAAVTFGILQAVLG